MALSRPFESVRSDLWGFLEARLARLGKVPYIKGRRKEKRVLTFLGSKMIVGGRSSDHK
jgi:hypothetical protein